MYLPLVSVSCMVFYNHCGVLLKLSLQSDSWTINAVAQDDFSDVPIPDVPAQPPHTPHTGVEKPVNEALFNQQKDERLASRT